MIPIYSKAKKNIREKLGKKFQICQFLSDGINIYPFISFVNDIPLLAIKTTRHDFQKTYINHLLINSGFQPLYNDLVFHKEDNIEDFGEMSEIEKLEFALLKAEENQHFELAANLRDKIKQLKENGKG